MNVTIYDTSSAAPPGFLAVRPVGSTNVTSLLNWYLQGPFVQDANFGSAVLLEPLGQYIWPPAICVSCRTVPVGQRRAESHNRNSAYRCGDVYSGKEWPGCNRFCDWKCCRGGRIASSGRNVIRLLCQDVGGTRGSALGQEQADCNVRERRHLNINCVAHDHSVRQEANIFLASEGYWSVGTRIDVSSGNATSDVCAADDDCVTTDNVG